MLTYLLRRILLMIPTLLGITLVVFTVMAMSPGGLTGASMVGGAEMKPEAKQALIEYYNKRYGLDDPAPVQYLRWLNNVSPVGFLTDENNDYTSFSFTKGSDLGESVFFGQSVMALIKDRLPITLLLNVITIPLIYLIAIIVGMNAARDRGGRFDVSSNVFMLALWSLPSMLVGVLMIGFFSSVQNWQWFPTGGLSSSEAYQMPFLPHWSSVSDILKLLVFGVAGVTAGLVFAQLKSVSLRKLIAGLLGVPNVDRMATDEAAETAIEAVEYLRTSISLPTTLTEIGGRPEDLSNLADTTMSLQRLVRLSPCDVTKQDIENILKSSL